MAKQKKRTKAAGLRKPKKRIVAKKVNPIPENMRGATPYLYVRNAVAAIDFYKRAFGAKELSRMEAPPGMIGHAELKVGTALFMLSDEYEQMGLKSPQSYGGSPVSISLYVKNVDTFVEQAAAAGATILRPVADQFYGDRSGKLEDPFGHTWMIATHRENVSPKEMKKRAAALFTTQQT
jgi:PhnB protein